MHFCAIIFSVMKKYELIATTTFGLEAVAKREIEALGYKITDSRDGRLTYEGDARALVRSNLWLRTADRVYIKMAEFKAFTFEDLFQAVSKIAWREFLPEDANFIIVGTSMKSKLHSVPACQSIIEKAVVKAMGLEWCSKKGPRYTIRFMLQKDFCTIMMDSSGAGLHKRGYRVMDVAAPIKETLASAMVQLSFFKPGRELVDPFCGSGTIAIEAAMLAKNIAPGLNRDFDSRHWDIIPESIWKEEKEAAYKAIDNDAKFIIKASDIDRKAIKAAKENAIEAGVDDCIEFSVMDAKNLTADCERGIIITNPPYGIRIGDQEENFQLYSSLKEYIRKNPTWSLFLITADKEFENQFGKKADRRRKLYNGRIETCYYQYHGEK